MSTTPYRHRWIAYGAVIAASVMELMDATIVQVAAPGFCEGWEAARGSCFYALDVGLGVAT